MCFFDSDLAGARALAAFRELLGPELVSDARVRLGGSKDVNEFLVKRRDERCQSASNSFQVSASKSFQFVRLI